MLLRADAAAAEGEDSDAEEGSSAKRLVPNMRVLRKRPSLALRVVAAPGKKLFSGIDTASLLAPRAAVPQRAAMQVRAHPLGFGSRGAPVAEVVKKKKRKSEVVT